MHRIFTVIKREFLTRVKTKGFIIGTILAPLFILAMTILPGVLAVIKTEEQQRYAVIDMSGKIFRELEAALDQKNEAGERIYALQLRVVTPENLEPVKQSLRDEVDNDQLDGFMIIPENVFDANYVEFYGKNVSNFQKNREIRNAITEIIQRDLVAQYALDEALVEKLTRRVDLRTFRVGPGGEEKEDEGQTFILAFVLVMFLYMSLIFYGQFVLRAVLEEKSSRVVEVLISSLRPFQLMAGKILGVGSVGLLQFAIWAIAAALISAYAGLMLSAFAPGAAASFPVPEVPISVLVYFVVFFVLGYIFYSTMYAAVGAMVNSEQEAQQFVFPLVIFLVVPIVLLTFVISNPNATSSVVMSLIPFFSPIIMFTRVVVQMPPLTEILLSIVFLLLGIMVMIYLAAKIFRVGILMYGKRPTLPEIVRWIRY